MCKNAYFCAKMPISDSPDYQKLVVSLHQIIRELRVMTILQLQLLVVLAMIFIGGRVAAIGVGYLTNHTLGVKIIKMKQKIFYSYILLLSFATFLTACSKDELQAESPSGKDLTVLFSWESGFSGAGYDDAILKSVSESQAAHLDMKVHLIRPKSQAEALALMNNFTTNGTAEKALILCGPKYESLAQELHPGAGRILLKKLYIIQILIL